MSTEITLQAYGHGTYAFCYVHVMLTRDGDSRILHLFDCAGVGATLVRSGRELGYHWSHVPGRDTSSDGATLMGHAHRLRGVAAWTARRWIKTLPADLLHVHFGTRVNIANRWPQRPFVVHFHGTDIRDFYRDPRQRGIIQWGADSAKAVFYATPDLAEHARQARPDAQYLPNPVDLAELPEWQPSAEPRILFASRWGEAKGGAEQLELVARLSRALSGTGIRLEGLDWGENAGQAAALGVTLVPTMGKSGYLSWLAGAHVVVGQSTGLLGISELQAMGIGVPTVADVRPGLYPGIVPVLGQGGLSERVEAIVEAAKDPAAAASQLGARSWLSEHHDPATIVRQLAAVYAAIKS